jgi:hypothetical protein
VHLDLHGIGAFGPQAGGVAVEPYPVRTLPRRIAEAIRMLLQDSEEWQRRSEAARAFAVNETWLRKAERVLATAG